MRVSFLLSHLHLPFYTDKSAPALCPQLLPSASYLVWPPPLSVILLPAFSTLNTSLADGRTRLIDRLTWGKVVLHILLFLLRDQTSLLSLSHSFISPSPLSQLRWLAQHWSPLLCVLSRRLGNESRLWVWAAGQDRWGGQGPAEERLDRQFDLIL